jgi:hypothetical protein
VTRDRDQAIEQLLRRSAPAPNERVDACPDAEALAAMVDRSLTSSELREIEAHLAGCPRCQAVAAALVRTETAAAAQEDQVTSAAWWKSRRLINWLAPAAAASVAVALWFAVPGQRTPLPTQAPSEQQAAAPAVAEPAPAVESVRPNVSENRQRSQEPLVGGRAAADALDPQTAKTPQPADTRQDLGANRDSAAPTAAPAAPAPPAEPGARSDFARNEAARQAAPLVEEKAAARVFAETVDQIALEIRSPDEAIRWRIRSNVVERSTDAGATWIVQQTGAMTELLAGTAPAADICWLVGRGGVVLRTANSGRTWEAAASPATQDLVSVAASSALDASVLTVGGRRFATADGGRTWVPR